MLTQTVMDCARATLGELIRFLYLTQTEPPVSRGRSRIGSSDAADGAEGRAVSEEDAEAFLYSLATVLLLAILHPAFRITLLVPITTE